jgi:flagellar export protein FliJ
MKAFEFRLERIAEYRRQEAELSRNQLQILLAEANRLEVERGRIQTELDQARLDLIGRADLSGEDLSALAHYQSHVARLLRDLDRKRIDVNNRISKQRSVVLEADRKVKLLDRLKDRKFQEWRAASDREIDELAADSHMAKLAAARTAARSTSR